MRAPCETGEDWIGDQGLAIEASVEVTFQHQWSVHVDIRMVLEHIHSTGAASGFSGNSYRKEFCAESGRCGMFVGRG